MAYYLLKNEGVFVGGSSGLNVLGAVWLAKLLGPGHTIVTVLCDGGTNYRAKMWNPQWLEEKKLTVERTKAIDFVNVFDPETMVIVR